MKEYVIPTEYTVYSEIKIRANSLQEALTQVHMGNAAEYRCTSDGLIVRNDQIEDLNPKLTKKDAAHLKSLEV